MFGGALALALMGRGDEVAAERGHAIENKVDGLLRYLTAFGEVRALVLAGDFDTAANDPPTSSGSPRRGRPGVGHGERARRHRRGGARTVRGLRAAHGADRRRADVRVGGVGFRAAAAGAILLRAGALDAGAKMVAEVRTRFGRHVAVFGPQLKIAESAGGRGGKCQRRNRTGAGRRGSGGRVRSAGHRDAGAARRGAVRRPVLPGPAHRPTRRHRWPAGVGDSRARHGGARDGRGDLRRRTNSSSLGAKLSAVDAAQAAVAFEGADDRRRRSRRPRPRTGWPPRAAESARPHWISPRTRCR